jgi:hypothetical protein
LSGHVCVLGESTSVYSQECEWSCMCVRGIYDLSIGFWNCSV